MLLRHLPMQNPWDMFSENNLVLSTPVHRPSQDSNHNCCSMNKFHDQNSCFHSIHFVCVVFCDFLQFDPKVPEPRKEHYLERKLVVHLVVR